MWVCNSWSKERLEDEQQLCVSHSVSLPCFPLWEASRKQICETHLDLPHIPKLCIVSAEEELLVTATGKVGKDKVCASSGRFLLSCSGTAGHSVPLEAGAAAGFTLLETSHTPVLAPLSLCCSDTHWSFLLPQPLRTTV